MFSNTTRLASGNGTVAMHSEMGLYTISVWTEETGRIVAVQTIKTIGCDINAVQRARAAAKAAVAAYAAAN